MPKKRILIIGVIVFAISGIAMGFIMTGGNFTAQLTEIVTFGSKIVSSDGNTSVTQSVGSINLGQEKITGGNYEVISGGAGSGIVIQVGASSSLDNVKVYPNPYKPGTGGIYDNSSLGEGIVFSNLTPNANIKIFNIAGELVAEFNETDGDGKYLWDTRNSKGEKVASGVYIYYIKNPADGKQKTKGRIVIIR
jgi:hypothetical protein